ncbi:PREDICTED: cilia- and flagella-associated protein 36 isoform X2 [Cyprinodon variegatus]|uniref:Cilia- and flagella-associated protein 36 n=1 Tax=Cyprinodon variegatus TaxID=28743 RepID=A0A3Q2FQQ2_CYPVA|nr:PREDICTED: cilia- and flagella-associated protein 36 isoform X2 [Cyprinodon variegatus]
MAEDDSEWIIESIVGYLGSPEWVIPVTDFMENKCTVFDDEDENKLSYTDIHQQYKKLVEKLLENYMQEVGINEQQFLDACTSPFAKSKSLQAVFQPVLATDDFQMFRSLMVQKNTELQLQALRVIKEQNGALPECLTDGVDVMTELQQQEMKILEDVLKKSKEEYDEEMSRRLLIEKQMGSTSSSSSDKPNKGDEARSAALTSSKQSNTSKPTLGSSVQPNLLPAVRAPTKSSESSDANRHQAEEQSSSTEAAAEAYLEEAHREAGFSKPYTELSPSQQEQLQQRAAYLRQQRDKLHALKREKQKSRQAAEPEEPSHTPPLEPATNLEISAEEKKKLQKRKHLADKLKEEVVKK